MGQRGLRDRAADLLQRLARGAPVERDDAHEFARAWLTATGGDVALALLTAPEFEARRLIELCSRVVAEPAELTAAIPAARSGERG